MCALLISDMMWYDMIARVLRSFLSVKLASRATASELFTGHFCGQGRKVDRVCLSVNYELNDLLTGHLFCWFVLWPSSRWFEDEGNRSKNSRSCTGEKCCWSGQCNLEWGLSTIRLFAMPISSFAAVLSYKPSRDFDESSGVIIRDFIPVFFLEMTHEHSNREKLW